MGKHTEVQKQERRQCSIVTIESGANGLNLIEASHVLLVEPILNPAEELQAIGRVHRIGQKKATIVHRFVVKQSMEERIYSMVKSHQHEESDQGSHCTEENILTVHDLKSLFVEQKKKEVTNE